MKSNMMQAYINAIKKNPQTMNVSQIIDVLRNI
jgi:hypothetical protein